MDCKSAASGNGVRIPGYPPISKRADQGDQLAFPRRSVGLPSRRRRVRFSQPAPVSITINPYQIDSSAVVAQLVDVGGSIPPWGAKIKGGEAQSSSLALGTTIVFPISARSSVGQSIGLLSRGSQVRTLLGGPTSRRDPMMVSIVLVRFQPGGHKHLPVAQLEERPNPSRGVAGSSPARQAKRSMAQLEARHLLRFPRGGRASTHRTANPDHAGEIPARASSFLNHRGFAKR